MLHSQDPNTVPHDVVLLNLKGCTDPNVRHFKRDYVASDPSAGAP